MSHREHDSGLASNPGDSGYDRLFISPGIDITKVIDEQNNRTFKLYGDVEVPVYQRENGNQLVAPYLFKIVAGLHILIARGIVRTGKAWPAVAAAALLPFVAWLLPAFAEPGLKEPAPPLAIETVGSGGFDLGAMRGKVVLVDFWATWCAPCLAELPVIAKFYEEHRAEGFEVIALSVDRPRDKAQNAKGERQATL